MDYEERNIICFDMSIVKLLKPNNKSKIPRLISSIGRIHYFCPTASDKMLPNDLFACLCSAHLEPLTPVYISSR